MPFAELADAIVATARATLEAAISFINSHAQWNARVVYGDTDSMFVLLPGRTKESAFRIGAEMAEAVTALNPSPVKLKFEKVFLCCPCLAAGRVFLIFGCGTKQEHLHLPPTTSLLYHRDAHAV
jgi:DNA polymerase zeta